MFSTIAIFLFVFCAVNGLICPPSNFPEHIQTKFTFTKDTKGKLVQLCTAVPKYPLEVVDLVNWAAGNPGFKLHPFGKGHSHKLKSPTNYKHILISTVEHLNKLKVDKPKSTVTFQSGVILGELLSSLTDHGLGLLSVPNIHNVSMGGILSVTGGHGETDHGSSGTIANLISELTFVGYNSSSEKYELFTFSRENNAAEMSPLLGGHKGQTFIISATINVVQTVNFTIDVYKSASCRSLHPITILTKQININPLKQSISKLYKESYASKCGKLLLRATPVDHHKISAPMLSKAKEDKNYPEFNKVLWVEILTTTDLNQGCEDQALDEIQKMVQEQFNDVAIIRRDNREDFKLAQKTFRKYDPFELFNVFQ